MAPITARKDVNFYVYFLKQSIATLLKNTSIIELKSSNINIPYFPNIFDFRYNVVTENPNKRAASWAV